MLRLPLSFFCSILLSCCQKNKTASYLPPGSSAPSRTGPEASEAWNACRFQNTIIAIGGLVVQYVVNGYGFLFVAGFTATNKLYGILEMAAISYGYAIVTYVGQNLGAGEIGRIKKGVRSSTLLAFLTSALISCVMFIFGKQLLSMFISGDPSQAGQVLDIAWKYLLLWHVVSVSCISFMYTDQPSRVWEIPLSPCSAVLLSLLYV